MLLKEGIEAWNKRRLSETFAPDLRRAELQGANLRRANLLGADLWRADLQGADLRGADLRGAKLRGAELRGVDLRGAKLLEADLQGANLQWADLQAANLQWAELQGADLRRAELQGADLWRANLRRANLRGAELRGAKLWGAELLEADLRGAVVLSLKSALRARIDGKPDFTLARNLTQSQVNSMVGDTGVLLPEGLVHPDHWEVWEEDEEADGSAEAESDKSTETKGPRPGTSGEQDIVLGEPFVFLSYSSENLERVALIRSGLLEAGIACWWDQDIRPGDTWRSEIETHLKAATVVLTFWTEESVASDAVKEEASRAQKQRKFSHVRLDNSDLPYGYAETQYQSLIGWNGDTSDARWKRLVSVLKDRLEPPTFDKKRTRLGATGPRSAVVADGKIDAVDTPPDGRPELQDPPTLGQVYIDIVRVCESLIEIWRIEPPNTSKKISLTIEKAQKFAKERDANWFTWSRLHGQLDRQISSEDEDAWRGFDGEVKDLQASILRLRPFLKKELKKDLAEESADQPPELHLQKSSTEGIQHLNEAIDEFLEDPATVEVFTDRAIEEIQKDQLDLMEGLEDEANPNENVRQRRFSVWRVALRGIGGFAATSAAILAGTSVNLLTSPEAAKTLLTRMEQILDLISKFV